jgi:hypothetical protein
VVPAADAGTTHVAEVKTEFTGRSKEPFGEHGAPLVAVWFPATRTHRMVSPGAAVTFAGVNAKFVTETVITSAWDAPASTAASEGARSGRQRFGRAMPGC